MFISKYLVLSKEKIKTLERATLSQSTSLWLEERKERLTSSNFGFVINRQKKLFPVSILNRILKNNKNNFFYKQRFSSALKVENKLSLSLTECLILLYSCYYDDRFFNKFDTPITKNLRRM